MPAASIRFQGLLHPASSRAKRDDPLDHMAICTNRGRPECNTHREQLSLA